MGSNRVSRPLRRTPSRRRSRKARRARAKRQSPTESRAEKEPRDSPKVWEKAMSSKPPPSRAGISGESEGREEDKEDTSIGGEKNRIYEKNLDLSR